jgi:hypothetical protein
MQCFVRAIKISPRFEDSAAYIKHMFDAKYGVVWHCIVGVAFDGDFGC